MGRSFLIFGLAALFFWACGDNELIEKLKHLGMNNECERFMPKDGGKYGYEEWERLSKDFYACCKKYNSCWDLSYNEVENKFDTIRINLDKKTETPKQGLLKDALPFIECLSTDPSWEKKECVRIKNDTNNVAYKVFNDVKMQKRLDSICDNVKDRPEFIKPCNSLRKGKE
jgi:hypothetical protein